MVRTVLPLLAAAALGAQGARMRNKNRNENTKFIAGVPVLNYQQAYIGSGVKAASAATEEHWVVVVKKGTTDEQIQSLCSVAKCERTGHPSRGGMPFFEIHGTEDDLAEVIKAADGQVDFAEPDGLVSLVPEIAEATIASRSWGLDRVGAPMRSSDGAGVNVYVLDTGVRVSHDDFGGRAIPTLELMTGTPVKCPPNDIRCARDLSGHGTHCAGTIAGETFGIAPKATIHAVKVLDDSGSGSWSWSYEALDWLATDGLRPAISSMSLGGKGTQYAMRVAVDTAVDSGVVVIVAGGNDNDDACLYSPAFVPSAITVGSSTSNDVRSGFSNYGACTDIWAPGSSIVSAGIESNTAASTKSGTSMACPHVSGGAALLLAEDPKLSPAEVLAKLLENAEPHALEDLTWDDTNKLLWVGKGPAPSPAPTPAPPPPPSCPDFARENKPDGDGDCRCKGVDDICSLDNYNPNCPTSGGIGRWKGRYFSHTCEDCVCIPKPEPLKCPSFARSETPDSDGDCVCLAPKTCSTNGSDKNCPTSRGEGGKGGAYFSPTCTDCDCVSDSKPAGCPDFAQSSRPDTSGDCTCPYGQYCSTDGNSANCPTSVGMGGWGGGYFTSTCGDCKCFTRR